MSIFRPVLLGNGLHLQCLVGLLLGNGLHLQGLVGILFGCFVYCGQCIFIQ